MFSPTSTVKHVSEKHSMYKIYGPIDKCVNPIRYIGTNLEDYIRQGRCYMMQFLR